MKHAREYSEKEISIFEGIYDLLNQGQQLHKLKVSDIAAAAGVGKGTAYEYFSSKEDIIRQALGYHIMREVEQFFAFVFKQNGLAGMVLNAMDYVIDMQTRFADIALFVLNLDQPMLKQLVLEDGDMHAAINAVVNERVEMMVEIGRKEKLIGEDVTTEDCGLVLNGMMSSFNHEVKSIKSSGCLFGSRQALASALLAETEERLNALKERTLKFILKALK